MREIAMINKVIKGSILLMLLGASLLLNATYKTGYAAEFKPFWSEYAKDYNLFEGIQLAPSRETGFREYSITNKNSEQISLEKSFALELKKDGLPENQLEEMLSLYEVGWKEHNKESVFESGWMNVNEFLQNFNVTNNITLEPDQEYKLEFNVKLSEEAGNIYQGATLLGSLKLLYKSEISETIIKDGDGKKLPDTATNVTNMLLIGMMLLLLGSLIVISRITYLLLKKRGIANDI